MTFQLHHLIPIELELDPLIVRLTNAGLFEIDSDANLIGLSDSSAAAEAAGQAVHRGSHPAYTNFVRRVLNEINLKSNSNSDAASQVELLQRALQVNLNTPIGPDTGTPFRLIGSDLQNTTKGQGVLHSDCRIPLEPSNANEIKESNSAGFFGWLTGSQMGADSGNLRLLYGQKIAL